MGGKWQACHGMAWHAAAWRGMNHHGRGPEKLARTTTTLAPTCSHVVNQVMATQGMLPTMPAGQKARPMSDGHLIRCPNQACRVRTPQALPNQSTQASAAAHAALTLQHNDLEGADAQHAAHVTHDLVEAHAQQQCC